MKAKESLNTASALNRACSTPPSYGKDELKAVGTSGMLLHITKIILHHTLEEHNIKIIFIMIYVVGSKSFRPDIQKPRQMENSVRDI